MYTTRRTTGTGTRRRIMGAVTRDPGGGDVPRDDGRGGRRAGGSLTSNPLPAFRLAARPRRRHLRDVRREPARSSPCVKSTTCPPSSGEVVDFWADEEKLLRPAVRGSRSRSGGPGSGSAPAPRQAQRASPHPAGGGNHRARGVRHACRRSRVSRPSRNCAGTPACRSARWCVCCRTPPRGCCGRRDAESRMGDPGFEPGTSALSERRSNQLS